MRTTITIEEPVHCGVCRHRVGASDIISVHCDYDEPFVQCRFRCPSCGSVWSQEPCGRTDDATTAPPMQEVDSEVSRFRALMSGMPAQLSDRPPPSPEEGK